MTALVHTVGLIVVFAPIVAAFILLGVMLYNAVNED